MKFENKVAIITGSTRGIGRATAELFAKEGAKSHSCWNKGRTGRKLCECNQAAGGEAIFCKTDVTSDESLDNLVKTALDTYGKIDILVNNAGVAEQLPIWIRLQWMNGTPFLQQISQHHLFFARK